MPEGPGSLVLRDAVIFGSGGRVDITVTDGAVTRIGASGGRGEIEVACEGAMVSPAWVDSHVHVASPATPGRIDPAEYGPSQGVGALIDAGSAPLSRIGDLFETSSWVYALANIDSRGIRGEGARPDIGGGSAGEALARWPGRVVGIKVQASRSILGDVALEAIANAVRVAGGHGVPVMVHVGNPPPSLESVCDALRPGDVITHYAHGKPEGATLADGMPLPALRRAFERGVLLDVGHGSSSFSFRRCRELLRAGIKPAIISTDLHAASAKGPVVSLARTMSKLLQLGLEAEEVLAAVTSTPAAVFGLAHIPGGVEVGARANMTVFRLEDRQVETADSEGERLVCERWFQPLGCVLDGAWHGAMTPV